MSVPLVDFLTAKLANMHGLLQEHARDRTKLALWQQAKMDWRRPVEGLKESFSFKAHLHRLVCCCAEHELGAWLVRPLYDTALELVAFIRLIVANPGIGACVFYLGL